MSPLLRDLVLMDPGLQDLWEASKISPIVHLSDPSDPTWVNRDLMFVPPTPHYLLDQVVLEVLLAFPPRPLPDLPFVWA